MADENQTGDEAQVTEEAATEAKTQGDVQDEPEAVFTKAQMAEMQARLDKSEADKQKLFDKITSPEFLKSTAGPPAAVEPPPEMPDAESLDMMGRGQYTTQVLDPRMQRMADDAEIRAARQAIDLICANDPRGKLAQARPELTVLAGKHPGVGIPTLMAMVDAEKTRVDAAKAVADADAKVKTAATTAKTRARSAGTAKPTGGTATIKETPLQAFTRIADEQGYDTVVAAEEQGHMELLEK